jgi:signal transduction histidine kinase
MASDTGIVAPRPPLLQRITARQWLSIDVAFSLIFFLGGLASFTFGVQGKENEPHVTLLVVALILAAVPIAFRRKYPLPVLIVVTGGLIMATLLGQGFGLAPVAVFPLYTVATQLDRRTSVMALCGVGLAFLASLGLVALVHATGRNVTENVNDLTTNIITCGAAWFVGDSVRARRAYVVGLSLQAEQRQRREVERVQQSVAEERLEIARELHDIVAHSLSVIAIQSGVGRHVLDLQPEEARNALAAIETTSRSALEELRNALVVLRRSQSVEPGLIPAPGIADLTLLLNQCKAAGLTVSYRLSGEVVPVSPSMDLCVYRIVQEALTNVNKHAGTAQASVEIAFEEGAVSISIVDNGALHRNGAMLAPDAQGEIVAHHGIIGMSERAAMCGGSLTAGPRPEGGFEVRASLPLPASQV